MTRSTAGDPAAARTLARGYRDAAAVAGRAGSTATSRQLLLTAGWQGTAGAAAADLLRQLSAGSTAVSIELDDLAAAMDALAADLEHAQWLDAALHAAQAATDALLVADVIQLGIDPLSDAAAVAAEGGVLALTAALKDAVTGLVARLAAKAASKAAALAAVKGLARFAAPRLAVGAGISAAAQQLLGGHVDAASTGRDAAMGVVVPGRGGLPGPGLRLLSRREAEQMARRVHPEVEARGFPFGFSQPEDFAAFGQVLRKRLAADGNGDVVPAIQGSSTHGVHWRSRQVVGAEGPGDVDVALCSPRLFRLAAGAGVEVRGGVRTAPIKKPGMLVWLGLHSAKDAFPELGRPVNFMIYRTLEDAVTDKATVLVP